MTVQVKICGLSTADTMQAALDAGADFVGLVFFAKSPRNVLLAQAEHLARLARDRAKIVALVVDADDATLQAIAARVKPDFLQLHGSETPERVAAIKAATGISVIKAIKVREVADVAKALPYVAHSAFILFDALMPTEAPGEVLPGGNGVAFDWRVIRNFSTPFMLAGGLTPDNVADAVRISGASMVDVSSGVESAPGIKDEARIVKFIEAARAAS